ncbi:MAG: DUF2804 domain-containing protein [Bacilli bacterium]|nr:DUF2804 domain-containing protein [Bacilli bacterium]
MNKEIVTIDDLLDEKGNIKHPGYSKHMVQLYDRNMIKAGKFRIKEWDYYLIYNDHFGIALTIDDNSYMGLSSCTFIDFDKKTERTLTKMKLLTLGKIGLPSTSSKGNVFFKKHNFFIGFENDGKIRKIIIDIKNFVPNKDIKGTISLTEPPEESMVIMTPFNKDKHFYYNQKIVGLKAEGKIYIGEDEYDFSKNDTRAILDWGRGVWTYKNTWYWGGACFRQDGYEIGFNIGYGFGDTKMATENMLFINGKAHKIDKVMFNIPQDTEGKDDYMKPWTFSSNDGRFDMQFEPIIDRFSDINLHFLRSNQHQVFGYYSGTLTYDTKDKIEIKRKLGFAEKVINKW